MPRPLDPTALTAPTSSLSVAHPFPDPISGIIPFGSVNIFGGASGMGKTTLVASLCRHLTDGTPYYGRPTHTPSGLYYLAADRDWATTYATKFARVGLPDIAHYALPDDLEENPKLRRSGTQFDLFERCMKKLDPCPGATVFVDPIAPTFIRGDQNRAWDAATSMHTFRYIARTYQVTLFCFSNVVKDRTDAGFTRARDRISGSGALGAYSDTQFYLIEAATPDRRIFGWAPREDAEVEYVVRFNPLTKLYEYESGPWATGAAFTQSDHAKSSSLDPSALLLSLVPDTGIDTSDLQELAKTQLGMSRATFYRQLKVLLNDLQQVIRDEWGHVKQRKLS